MDGWDILAGIGGIGFEYAGILGAIGGNDYIRVISSFFSSQSGLIPSNSSQLFFTTPGNGKEGSRMSVVHGILLTLNK